LAVKFVVPDPDISSGGAITELYGAHAALETTDVVEKAQALDNHSRPAT
jgi:hypothetical protein